ncbi:AAA family ATPase [Allohahella marinimesophila]|uniref:AAA family ATPase n=2 Tax=Allohahella marinimesophila TaxID=1054972 RepID=A0ABP7NWT7_9GAMM
MGTLQYSMYEQHFGLARLPFTLTPNTRFYLRAQSHDRAFATVIHALRGREGFIKVTGQVGTGKTLLCRRLLNALKPPFVTAYIPNPQLDPLDLYRAVAEELGLQKDMVEGQHHLLRLIQGCLIEHAREGRSVVLVIDEAQVMSEATIEAVRLLTNLETESRKLLQVVLFGQPELDTMLRGPRLRQLLQRITFQERIEPFTAKEVPAYINHRLSMAGYNGQDLFRQGALRLVARSSGGVPRLINILAHKALLSAYGEGSTRVEARHARNAVRDTESAIPLRWPWSLKRA